jgi:2-polyprenyl-3-methyl-5-hydroxy-6-metoxy-1,4-benzoquinol methylase
LRAISAEEYASINASYDPGGLLEGSTLAQLHDFLEVDSKMDLLRRFAPAKDDIRFLDIGCGMGGYLLAAQQLGWEARGYEPSADHSRHAREELNLDVRTSYFDPANEPKSYDLIMLSHVIEHIYEPADFLAGVASALAPGGRLIVVTPNTDSLIARLTGRQWPMLQVPDHVTMITAKSLHRLTPQGMTCAVRTFEYPFEFAATFLAAARSSFRKRDARQHSTNSVTGQELKGGRKWLKTTLSVASAPFHAAAVLRRNQACLLAVYQ